MVRLLGWTTNLITRPATDYPPTARNSMALEVLHLALVLLRRGARLEGAEVAALAGLGIGLARIEPVFARSELADHGDLLRCERRRHSVVATTNESRMPARAARMTSCRWPPSSRISVANSTRPSSPSGRHRILATGVGRVLINRPYRCRTKQCPLCAKIGH